MNVETYIENQIAELEAELSDKRVEFASCIQPADWAAFSTSAAKKLNKAYGSFCWAIRWRVTWGWFAGTSSIQMGSRTQTYFLKHGAFRLIAAVEQAAFVRFPGPGDPTDSIYDYPQLTLSATRLVLSKRICRWISTRHHLCRSVMGITLNRRELLRRDYPVQTSRWRSLRSQRRPSSSKGKFSRRCSQSSS
jgi:hypothetical protein